MRSQWLRCMMAAVVLAVSAQGAWAQDRNVTVKYLRAALGSIADRAGISVEGEYSGQTGLVEARGSYLRNKGYSRFTIKDPDTGLTFGSIYCEQDSNVFDDLLAVKGTKRFVFHGYKGTGEGREDAVFVTSLTPVREPQPVPREEDDQPSTYRVTLIDHATSNRTVMVNVELGKPLNMLGSTLIIEEEPREPNKVRVLR